MDANKVSAAMIRTALEETYAPPEWYLGFEVGNSTGANCRRYADAVAVNAYQSRGYEIRGFEIKVSKQDLALELKNANKAEEVAQYCDYWFLVVPKGMADGATLPASWGLIEYSEGKLRQKISAKRMDAKALTNGFLCAMLRGRQRVSERSAKQLVATREADIRLDAVRSLKSDTSELAALKKLLREIEDRTGLDLSTWAMPEKIARRLKAARAIDELGWDLNSIEGHVSGLASALKRMTEHSNAIIAAQQKAEEKEKSDDNH